MLAPLFVALALCAFVLALALVGAARSGRGEAAAKARGDSRRPPGPPLSQTSCVRLLPREDAP